MFPLIHSSPSLPPKTLLRSLRERNTCFLPEASAGCQRVAFPLSATRPSSSVINVSLQVQLLNTPQMAAARVPIRLRMDTISWQSIFQAERPSGDAGLPWALSPGRVAFKPPCAEKEDRQRKDTRVPEQADVQLQCFLFAKMNVLPFFFSRPSFVWLFGNYRDSNSIFGPV